MGQLGLIQNDSTGPRVAGLRTCPLVNDFTNTTSQVQLQLDDAVVHSSLSDVDPITRKWANDRVASTPFGPIAMARYEIVFTTTRDADHF